MKNFRQRLIAFVAGVLIGPAVVWAGLESGVYISDLVATNPLGSDLASTIDDHIRLVKSTVKTTFPNIDGAVTVTDEVLNAVPTGSANPTGTIGLTAVNGSATTYLRSDGAPALSQALAPNWSAQHIFSLAGSGSDYGVSIRSSQPGINIRETDGAANNQDWQIVASGEQLGYAVINSSGAGNNYMTVDRTGTTVDRVHFPTEGSGAFLVGTVPGAIFNSARMLVRAATAGTAAAQFNSSSTATAGTVFIQNEATSGDNLWLALYTETGGGTLRGSIDFNRAGTLTRYNTTSDAGLKKNFKPAPSARGVIDCIQIESYDWRETGSHVDHGVVAQRLDKCAPYAVSKGKVWQVDKSTLIPAMLKYIQEQDARITALERRLH